MLQSRDVEPVCTQHLLVRRSQQGSWQLATGERGACPAGSVFELPRHPKENSLLQRMLQKAGVAQAWLPLQGDPAAAAAAAAATFPKSSEMQAALCRARLDPTLSLQPGVREA